MTLDARFSRLPVCGACAMAIASLIFFPARAEFPPEGATPDPNNASIATADYPSPSRDGVALHTVFYFDCGTRNWVGVPVKASSGSQNSTSQAAGPGREYPPGPPTGSTRDATNPNHAFNKSTGQNFTFRDGNWVDTKSGKLVKAPKLCPDSVESAGDNALKKPGEQRETQNPPAPPADNGKDHLPAAPQYIPGQLPTSRP